MRKISNKIKGITIEVGGDTTLLNKALADVNRNSRELSSELRDVERLLKLDPGNTELVAQKQKILSESVDTTAKKLEQLKEAERQVQEQFKKGEVSEEQYRAIQREIIKTEDELKKLNSRLQEMDWKGITDGLDKFGNSAVNIGKNLTTKVTAPIVAVGAAGTKMALDLEHSIKKVTTLADKEILPVSKIEEEVRAISDASGIAQAEVAGAIYDALSAGVASEEVLSFVRSGIDLTRAGFTDMSVAIDAITTVLNAYGEDAFEVSKIHDIFVQTQDKGKISVDELGKSIGRVIPTASSLGVNLDELGASYAILTAKGQNAQLATTNLNSMLAELGKSGSKTDTTLKEMTGKSFAELVSEGRNVGEVLGIIDEHAKANNLSLKDMFGSMTAGNAAITLFADGVDGYNKSLDDMQNSTGKTAENAKTMEDGLFKIQKAMNQIKNATIEFGATFAPVVEKVAEMISVLVENFTSMDDGVKQIIFTVVALAAALGPVILVLGKMSLGISSMISLFGPMIAGLGGAAGGVTALSGVIAALTGPIGIAVAAIGVISAAIMALWKTNEDFREGMRQVWENVKTIIESSINLIKGIIGAFTAFFTGDWDKLKFNLTQIWSSMWSVLGNILSASVGTITTLVKGLGTSIANIFTGMARDAFDWGANLINGFIDGIKSMTSSVTNAVSNVVGNVKDFIGFGSPSKKGEGRYITEWGANMIAGFIDGIDQAMPDLTRAMDGLIPDMGNQVNQSTVNTSNSFTVHAVIREEQDIKRVAQELYNLQQRSSRGRGVLA